MEARALVDQHRAEVLILEGNPLKRFLDLLGALTARLETLYIPLGEVIVDTAILPLELPGLLLLGHSLPPLDILRGHVHGQ